MAKLRQAFFACLLATAFLGVFSQDVASRPQQTGGDNATVVASRGCPKQSNGNPEAISDVRQGCVARVFWEEGCLRRSLKCGNPASCGSNEEVKCGGTCEPSCRVRRPRCSTMVPCVRSHCDCIQGFIRNELGLCVRENQCHAERECLTDIDCKDGWQCFNDRCRQPQHDPDVCSRDADCRRNQNCVRGRCREACFRNNDCGRNEFCDRGRCREQREPECATNKDCNRRQVCARGRCLNDRFAPSNDEEKCGNTTCLGDFMCMNDKCMEMHHGQMNEMLHDGACLIDDDCEMTEICQSSMCAPAKNDTSSGKVTFGEQRDFRIECRFDRDCRPGMRCFNAVCEDRFDGCDRRGCPRGHFCSRDRCIERQEECRRDRDCRRGEFCFRGRCRREECRGNGNCSPREVCIRGRCIDRRFSFRMHVMCIEDIDCDGESSCDNGVCTVRLSHPRDISVEATTQPSATCSQEIDCVGDSTCVNGNCIAKKQNQQCAVNSDCMSQERCINNRCDHSRFDRCNNRCAQDEMCFNAQCVRPRPTHSDPSVDNSDTTDKSPTGSKDKEETSLF
uniref:DUF7107 domain-containing protein n=1 Tax=Plectus sambesii TaxID=2011161 RepID=A0A914VGI5_9BILA